MLNKFLGKRGIVRLNRKIRAVPLVLFVVILLALLVYECISDFSHIQELTHHDDPQQPVGQDGVR